MYHIEISSSTKKDLRKLSHEVQIKIVNEIFPSLILDPYQGEILHGEFKQLWKFSIKYKKTEYRIVYEIFKKELVIILIMIGARENFYKKLRQRIR